MQRNLPRLENSNRFGTQRLFVGPGGATTTAAPLPSSGCNCQASYSDFCVPPPPRTFTVRWDVADPPTPTSWTATKTARLVRVSSVNDQESEAFQGKEGPASG